MAVSHYSKRKLFRIVIPVYPAFNIYSEIALRTTALGPVCVASVISQMPGWDVEVIDENNLRCYGPQHKEGGADHEYLQRERPADIVGLYGGLTSTIPRLYKIARFYKEKQVITIAGGQHFVDENLLEAFQNGIDYVVLGEGELTINELIAAIVNKTDVSKVRGIAYLRDGKVYKTEPREPIVDFDILPLPNFSLVRYARIKLYPVGRIRGCGMDCEFCTVKGKPRNASPKRFLENFRFLVETRDARHFFVVDDLFGQYRQETIDFCNMLADYQESIGRRLDITVQIRLDKANDSELLLAMRRAGINSVAIGFESPIEEELKAMNKKIRPENMIELARTYHKFGFLVHGMFIFGYPFKEATNISLSLEERIKRFRNFIKRAKIDTIQVLLPVPLPGTELRQRLKQQNRIYPTQFIGWEYYDGNFPTFEPDAPLTPLDLQLSIRKIMGKFYRLKYMLLIGIHLISFPLILMFFYNIKKGWRKWYREWRNALVRFSGWIIIKGWTIKFKKGSFVEKLESAQQLLAKNGSHQNIKSAR